MYSTLLKYRKNSIKCTNVCRQFTRKATVDKMGENRKDTIFKKLFTFWRSVLIDYSEMLKDLRTDVKEKPARTALLLTGFSFFVLCAKTNPNKASFKANHIE